MMFSPLVRLLLRAPASSHIRALSLSPACRIKEIEHIEKGNQVVVEGRYRESPRKNYLVPEVKEAMEKGGAAGCPCPLCRLGLFVQHTDVLILRQFVDSRGKLIPRNITGLCRQQHKRLDYLLVMAEKAGLLDRFDKDGKKRELVGWESLNKYYDENVIEEFVHYKTRRSRA